ncbi:D-2-hydroxyacid dehydrogenase [Lactobacillus sp. CC-MHH1034]|uniref:D-2-hydroxyacid dehydrogenase n=1 Tax=Agrilactobacillus fermenti TaxID=2586909 RepID=UPI001E491496|nr:D-2-hydroxyacid dehydrogenase [Agrilactobacillus fermenti]MCD2255653.1 D-2-hydroxyacid dehydrogenase [Agrilactobacillus fermenti]
MKIVVLDGHALNPGDLSWSGLEALGDVTVYDRTDNADQAEILQRIGTAEIVLVNKTPLDATVIQQAPNLQYIGVLATGYNVVDVAAAQAANIPVTNIPTYGTETIAQYAFALLLEITSQVGPHSQAVHDGEWAQSPDFTFWKKPLIELMGKTIGLIGYGRIAAATAKIAHAFGMRVIFYNHKPKTVSEPWLTQVELTTLYHEADIISLHVPQTPETTKMIDAVAIAQMKSGVILINTARGGLLDEPVVAQALNDGKIYAAGLDVVAEEPIRADNPLLTAKNTFITPHVAWAPTETRARLLSIGVDNVKQFLAGHLQHNVW